MMTIRARLNRLEVNAAPLANGENLTADFIRRCLVSDGLHPDKLPPLTEEDQAWAEEVLRLQLKRTLTGDMLARIEALEVAQGRGR